MLNAIDQTMDYSEHHELPRFLNRDEDGNTGLGPPRLPGARWKFWLLRLSQALPRKVLASVAVGAVAVPAVAMLVDDSAARKPETALPAYAGGIHAGTSRVQLASSQTEDRLGYAGSINQRLQDGVTLTVVETKPSTFDAGPAGPVAEPPLAAVAIAPAEITEIERPGPVAAVIPPPTDPAPVPAEDAVAQDSDTAAAAASTPKTAERQTAEPKTVAADDQDDEKPIKRSRHKRVRAHNKIAEADGVPQKRVKRTANHTKVKLAAATAGKDEEDDDNEKDKKAEKDPAKSVAATPSDSGDVKKPGPLSKLFSWLKSGTSEPTVVDEVRANQAAMFPQ
jgi:hypothetical protein